MVGGAEGAVSAICSDSGYEGLNTDTRDQITWTVVQGFFFFQRGCSALEVWQQGGPRNLAGRSEFRKHHLRPNPLSILRTKGVLHSSLPLRRLCAHVALCSSRWGWRAYITSLIDCLVFVTFLCPLAINNTGGDELLLSILHIGC